MIKDTKVPLNYTGNFKNVLRVVVLVSVLYTTVGGMGIQDNRNGHNSWFEIIVDSQMLDEDNEVGYDILHSIGR